MQKFIYAAVWLFVCVFAVCAQADEMEKNEYLVWGGYSPDSNTFITAFGRTENARFGIAGLRYARRFNTGKVVNLKYTADLIPAAILHYPDIEILPTVPPSARLVRPTRYAFGLAPLGVQANFRPRKSIQPFVAASGGLLYFNQRILNNTGSRFAFTADAGGGVEFRIKENRAVTLGYKYYHISNGDRGIENPGFDNNLFYIGYTFFSN